MRILIHYLTLLDDLFKTKATIESLNYSWHTLSSENNVQAYISSRGREILYLDICSWAGLQIATEVISLINAVLETCSTDREIMGLARSLDAPFDIALEVAVAVENRIDFILTNRPEDFRSLNLSVLSLDGWLSSHIQSNFQEQTGSVALVEGELQDLQRLSEFTSTFKAESDEVVNLENWNQNLFDPGWQSLQILVPIRQQGLGIIDSSDSSSKCRGKLLTFNTSELESQLILLVSFRASPNSEVNLQVGIFPKDIDAYLPRTIRLEVLDELGIVLIQEECLKPKRDIQLSFSGEKGENFQIKAILGHMFYVENFVI